ncbi:MAG: hypothetical protein LBL41_04950, partial [Bifidobacteriaceae bacterium]|nr:hypothetical protein [Bifidobacteriaceae bacterium]
SHFPSLGQMLNRWVKCSIAFSSSVRILLSRPRIGVRGSEVELTKTPEQHPASEVHHPRPSNQKQNQTPNQNSHILTLTPSE